MSGPALKQWDSHSSIHEAALGEADQLTELLRQCVDNNDRERSMEVASILVEHWESRTLRHAEAEEEGLYIQLVEKNPALKDTITELIRDHNLMRFFIDDIKKILAEAGELTEVLKRFDALILVDLQHNIDEGTMVRGEM